VILFFARLFVFLNKYKGKFACEELQSAIIQVQNKWEEKIKVCELRTDGLLSWCSTAWLRSPHVGKLLKMYTRNFDEYLNGYLRRGQRIPWDFVYRLMFVKTHRAEDGPVVPREDVSDERLSELLKKFQTNTLTSADTYVYDKRNEISSVLKLNEKDLEDAVIRLDNYFEKEALRTTEYTYVFRQVTGWDNMNDLCTKGYTSTTTNWDSFPFRFMDHARGLKNLKNKDVQELISERALSVLSGSIRAGDGDALANCCYMLMRLNPGIPFVALGENITDSLNEHEVLLPRGLQFRMCNVLAVCDSSREINQIVFFIDVTR
jgi:hypothetical protein